MHDERRLVEARLRRELRERIKPAIHGKRILIDTLSYDVPGEPVSVSELADVSFAPIAPGTPWGRPWGTTWFRATGAAPAGWASPASDLIVELGFSTAGPGFQAEGLVYVDGIARRGIHPRRRTLSCDDLAGGGPIELLVEAAANPDFNGSHQPSQLGSLDTAGTSPLYVFGGIWLAERHDEVVGLVHDFEVLGRLMTALPDTDARRHRITRSIEQALDALDLYDIPGTTAAARAAVRPALDVPARAGSHRVFAIGHAHIDTAWLWPIRETMRKCARTFANAVDLMDQYPEYRFACSQAAQYAWIETQHPELFERIRAKVANGQWLPVGGMWVEADMNLPSGESILRQLIHGQRYFESRFGKRCSEVWIPDVFGYPGSLPQMFAAGGCTNFVTQKLSWNKQNKMPHNTFWWEGIDGTRVMTHFPPVDTYNAEMHPDENVFAAANFSDKAWSSASILPFGYGNGGGGPTAEMLERARRMTDLDGVPQVAIEGPEAFFELVRDEADATGLATPVWRGELYFEMHRGTFTSQTKTKLGNRSCERLFREAELYWALVSDRDAYAPVQQELDALWKEVLVQQFHDIIPGSSIAWVHHDAERIHTRVAGRLEALIAEAISRLSILRTPGTVFADSIIILNPATSHRREIVITSSDVVSCLDLKADTALGAETQALPGGRIAFAASARGLGQGERWSTQWFRTPVTCTDRSMSNEHLEITWDESGRLTSIVAKSPPDLDDRVARREVLPHGTFGAELSLAPDHPVEYDAWDVERWTARRSEPLVSVDEIQIDASGPLVGEVTVVRSHGRSRIATTYRLCAGSQRLDISFDIDWHEDEKLLAVNFPLDVHVPTARCGIQFGHVERPRHANTSWDLAKFEVCAHRWVDVSEPSFGVAILNDGRYGHAVQGDGIRVTLLRAANYPDPTADRGHHRTTVSVFPHSGRIAHVVQEAERLNLPMRVTATQPGALPDSEPDAGTLFLGVEGFGVEVSAVKLADDATGDVIVRLAEMCGDRREVRLTVAKQVSIVEVVDVFEEPTGELLPLAPSMVPGQAATMTLRPFQLVTIRIRRPLP
jgi:alpha-mannosidase